MIVVSYHTDAKYARYAERLKESLARLGIRHCVESIDDLGSWKANTHQKAFFVRRKMEQYRNEDAVVWVDADAIVASELLFFEEASFDFAAYRWRDSVPYHSKEWHNFGRLLSGTLYFRTGNFSRMILDAWESENLRHPERMDQKNLATVLSKVDASRLACLPPEYCWIERHMRKTSPLADPVVIHAAAYLKDAPKELKLEDVPPVLIESYHGLGDAFYMRPALRGLLERRRDAFLENPWPQLFEDLQVPLVKPREITLRVQKKNADRPFGWKDRPSKYVKRFLSYDSHDFESGRTPIRAFMKRLGVKREPTWDDFQFPAKRNREKLTCPYALVHLPTIRQEWKNTSRAPMEGYIQELAEMISFPVISLDPSPGSGEVQLGKPIKFARRNITDSELSIEELIDLVSNVSVVLTNVCFLLPMAAALGTPVFTVFGGSVRPELLIEPCMGPHVGYVAPEPFCNCIEMEHDCAKEIPRERMRGAWSAFLRDQVIR